MESFSLGPPGLHGSWVAKVLVILSPSRRNCHPPLIHQASGLGWNSPEAWDSVQLPMHLCRHCPLLSPRSQLFQSHFIDGGVEVRGSWAICLEVTSKVEARIWAPWIPAEYPTTLPKAWSMDHTYSQPTVLSLIAPWAMTPSCDEK